MRKQAQILLFSLLSILSLVASAALADTVSTPAASTADAAAAPSKNETTADDTVTVNTESNLSAADSAQVEAGSKQLNGAASEAHSESPSRADKTETGAISKNDSQARNISQGKSSLAAAEIPPPFKIAGENSRFLQKKLGLTWLSQESIDVLGYFTAKLVLHGQPRFKVELYSLSDALSGKFKSVSLDLKNCSFKNVPLADLSLKTSTPLQVRLLKSKKGSAGVAVPVMVAVKGCVDETKVSQALESPIVSSELNFLRLDIPGLGDQHLQILEPKVTLKDGKVKIHSWLVTAGAPKDTGITVDITAKPFLEKERLIMLQDTDIQSPDIINPDEFSMFTQKLLNPLLDVARFDRKTHAFRFTEFKLGDKKLDFAGKLLLVPKPVPEKNAQPKLSEK